MNPDDRFLSDRYPRSSRYHPEWIIKNGMSGSNTLRLTEWLSEAMDPRPGMRVLDLGCGRAISSIFLAREFGVQVWAADLWISATENLQRIRDAGLEGSVFPLHVDARALPFAGEFFDAVMSIDSFAYYGTDDLYLNYIAHFLKPGGLLGIAGAGLVREFDGGVPSHLSELWTQDFWAIHSADWWKRHWERTGLVEIRDAETMPDGWLEWLDWQRSAHPENLPEIQAVEADAGRCLSYYRLIAQRKSGVTFQDYCWPDTMRSLPMDYERKPLLRTDEV